MFIITLLNFLNNVIRDNFFYINIVNYAFLCFLSTCFIYKHWDSHVYATTQTLPVNPAVVIPMVAWKQDQMLHENTLKYLQKHHTFLWKLTTFAYFWNNDPF